MSLNFKLIYKINNLKISSLFLGLSFHFAFFFSLNVFAQGVPPGMRVDNKGRPMGPGQQGMDSLQQRDSNEDSITIYYRMFDSSRIQFIDSSVSDYYKRFPLPIDYLFLNQYGGATRSLLFQPNTQPGYDPGFHAYDPYHFSVANTRFYNTTRPYTELDYILGGRAEQSIKLTHTQNITPLWNVTFDYRLINSPGHFKSSSTNHSAIKFSSSFSSKNRRYSGFFVALRNRTKANENGGIRSDTFLTSSNPAFFERFNIPTWLGFDEAFDNNFFTSALTTGFGHYNQTLYLRHQYDIGQKEESYTEDSSLVQKFYPRIRFQHNFQAINRGFTYVDENLKATSSQEAYLEHFNLPNADSLGRMTDRWREITNEAAIILFPEKNNQDQFLRIGGAFQYLRGWFAGVPDDFHGTYLFGEYRNRTRNRKWDINANGKIFTTGPYAGNFLFNGTLATDFGKKLGSLVLGFQNSNRTPGFIFNPQSNFVLKEAIELNNENWTTLSGDAYINKLGLKLSARYYLVSNYTYWKEFTTATQDATLQSILRIGGEKKFKLTRRWNLYSELYMQQSTSSGINLPLIYTRNRLAYEGNFYANLNLSSGLEFRYFTPFTADNFTPFNGQWVAQSDETFNNFPDLAAFLHIRIRSFRGFLRAENLNTFSLKNGLNWTNNTVVAPLYANPGLILRIGIYWSFVN
jgi:hypothetical protein